jgi:hypothetical protein
MKMERKKSITIKLIIFLVNIVIFISMMLLYLNNILIFEGVMALLFFQALFCGIALFLYSMYKRLQSLARSLNFKYLKDSFPHPKFEGHYKNNWWQLHFTSKEEGQQWGMPRTYIKLQYKEKKEFDVPGYSKYSNIDFKGNRIIEIRHIVRDYKNYLLLKRAWFTFDKKKIYELMDLLLKVAAESEIKGKKKK